MSRKPNYALRPAKNIERKMLCEALRRLSPFGSLPSYRYVGFGSYYFSDFSLLHRSLGIRSMISIERDVSNQERYLFNRPFSCIRVLFGDSNSHLPALPWDQRTILWLDYEDKLDGGVLADVACFSANATSGSVIIVTVNAQAESQKEDPVARLRERVGHARVDPRITRKLLSGDGTANIYRDIITNEILDTVVKRNGARAEGDELRYSQLFHFRYADNAKMLTVGGVLYDEGQADLLDACEFSNLDFYRSGESAHAIRAPGLTLKELRHLAEQLPRAKGKRLKATSVPLEDLKAYEATYRYFPTFVEAEL